MGYGKSGGFDGEGGKWGVLKMVAAAILAAIMGIGSAVIVLTLYALHRLTGGKMSLKKWFKLNFEF